LAGTISIASPALGYLYSVWMLSHRENLGEDGVSQNLMLALIIWGAVCHLVTVALGAVLADKFSQKRVFLWGAGLLGVFAFPFFWLVDTGAWYNIAIAFVLMLLAQSLMAGPQAALVAELFPAEIRYSGASVASQFGSMLGGVLMPLISTSLYAACDDASPIATYTYILAAVSFVAMAVLKVGKYRASVD